MRQETRAVAGAAMQFIMSARSRIVSPNTVLALAAGMFSAALAAAAACRKQRSLATWCFSAGMLVFALESLFGAIGSDALLPERAAFWETLCLVAKSFLPGVWLTLQPDVFQGKLPRFSRPIAVACYRRFLDSAVVAGGSLQLFLLRGRLRPTR